jgi:hypothetical protein
LTSRLFVAFLEEFRANKSELLYHIEVPLSSIARVLLRFVAFREEMHQFLENFKVARACSM